MERRASAQRAIAQRDAAMTARWAQRGSTLIELLTSTVFLSILMAMSYSFARATFLDARVQELQAEVQESSTMALDVLVREVRMAGFSARGDPLVGIRDAQTDRLDFVSDFNGDGDVSDTNEHIVYEYDDRRHQVTRATGGGSPQPFVRNVPDDGWQLRFFDAAGSSLVPGAAGLSSADREAIRRIDVALTLELPNPSTGEPIRSLVEGSICLRNQ